MRNAILIPALCLLLAAAARAETDPHPPEDPRPPAAADEPGFRLLTRYLVAAEAAAFGRNDTGYALRTVRRAHLRILDEGDWFLDTLYKEELLWSGAMDQVNHTFDYVRVGRAFSFGDLFFFWNHTCRNAVAFRGTDDIHWNDLGVEWSTDARPGADRERTVHLRGRAGAAFMLSNCEYRWMAEAHARFRLPAGGGASAFARISLDLVGEPERVTLCPILETGFTVPLGAGLAVEPFLRVDRRRDASGVSGENDTWILAGLRVVQFVEPDAEGERFAREHLAFLASYATRLGQEEIGYVSNVTVRLLLPEPLPGARGFFDVHTGVNTPPEDMFPNFVTATIGPTLSVAAASNLTLRGGYRYRERRAVGHHWSGDRLRLCHVVSLEASSAPPPPASEGLLPFAEPFTWSAGLELYPSVRAFPYRSRLEVACDVSLGRLQELGWNLRGGLRYYMGPSGRSLGGVMLEADVVLPGTAGDWRFYLRLEHAWDPLRFGENTHAFLGFEFRYL